MKFTLLIYKSQIFDKKQILDTEPISVIDHNSMMIDSSADFLASLEASRWSSVSVILGSIPIPLENF